ncbi:Uma2 family endonuclease [Plantactinospora sp. B6F1]|uniref:Uma2 family endonuclease n=1 Tax=Plantactinospora sp. B6F1 TaxID=3158971 RepID=UPI0032D94FEE
MSAEPVAEMPGPWQPDPVRQRQAGYTLEDLLHLPPDAPRVELVDGVIRVVPSPTLGHQNIAGLLWSWLRAHVPAHLRAAQAVGVALGTDFTREAEYAAAGIACYWRVEQDPVRVHAYRLADRPGRSGNREYELLAEADELLELAQPFPIKLAVGDITP